MVKGTSITAALRAMACSGLVWWLGCASAKAQAPVPFREGEAFINAIAVNDTNTAARMLEANTNLVRFSLVEKQPLLEAAAQGNLPLVKRMVELGADINVTGDTYGSSGCQLTALHVAIKFNRPAICLSLLEAGADPKRMAAGFMTPLHVAFEENRGEMASWLLDFGADPFREKLYANDQTTPFELAITRSDGKLVPRMLSESRVPPVKPRPGAQLLTEDILPPLNPRATKLLATNGLAWLTVAAQRGELEAVEALLRAGVSPRGQPAGGWSVIQAFALGQAGASRQKDFSAERWAKLRDLLEKSGADCDAFATTALGDLRTARQLVSADKSVLRTVDHLGDTPLHWAVRNDQLPFTAFWLEAGVSAAVTNVSGQTALHLAAGQGLVEHVKLLLAAHAPADIFDTNGWTPLDSAIQAQQPTTIRLLLKSNAPTAMAARGLTTPVHKAAANGNIVVLTSYVNTSNVEARDELGLTPLLLAGRNGQLGAAALLVDKGANVNARDPDGNTVLHLILQARAHWIAGMPSSEWIERLKQDPQKAGFAHALTTESDYTSAKQVARSVAFFLACGAEAGATNRAGKTILQIAVDENSMLFGEDRAALLKLIGTTKDGLDAKDANGDTPLHVAVRGFDGEWVTELLASGANLEATNSQGRTSLHVSLEHIMAWGYAAGGDGPVQVLLQNKPNVNAPDNEGLTPLHVVALSDSAFRDKATRALLDSGANPNLRDKHQRTPVHLFLSGEWPWTQSGECLELLAKAGADFSARDDKGRTPLHYLATLGGNHRSLFFIRNIGNTFAAAKVDLDAPDNQGDTPLHLAARSGATDVFEWLSKLGASLAATNAAAETPLRISARQADPFGRFQFDSSTDIFTVIQRGDIEALGRLLTAEPTLATAMTRYGETPLRIAARLGNTNAVELLVEKGAHWDAVSAATLGRTAELQKIFEVQPQAATNKSRGKTLLHLAAESGVISAAEAVLTAGAAVNARDPAGFSPLGSAHLKGRKEMEALLRDRGAVENIFDAVLFDDVEGVFTLLARDKASGAQTNSYGFTPVHLAAALGHDRALAMLLERKISPGAIDNHGDTPLHLAAVCNRSNAAALLLGRRAVVEPFDHDGFTPLHLAALCGSADVAALLIKHGAKPDTKTRPRSTSAHPAMPTAVTPGSTALHLAALSSETNLVQLLIRARASLNATNAAGLSPWNYASSGGFTGADHRVVLFWQTAMAIRSALQQQGVTDLANRHPPMATPAQKQVVAALLEAAGAKPTRPPRAGGFNP